MAQPAQDPPIRLPEKLRFSDRGSPSLDIGPKLHLL
jgi:hypothetical protein